MARATDPTRSRAARGKGSSTRRPRQAALPKGAEAVGRPVAAIRDLVTRSVLAPVNAVLLTRKHIEDVAEDAVMRGRMTRDDAQQMIQSLLQRGTRQTEEFLSDLERLLGRGRELDEGDTRRTAAGSTQQKGETRRPRARRPAASLPIPRYDRLSASQVQERLDGLTPADLRRLRDYERRHANRKTVLDRIERKLR
jgi:polyhydroxyalkanoate synthesis regulator phasin